MTRKEYYEKNKKEVKQKRKEYKEKNEELVREQRKAQGKRYRAKHQKEIKEYADKNRKELLIYAQNYRDSHEETKLDAKIRSAKSYQNNKQQILINQKEYRKTHKEKNQQWHHNYMARKKNNGSFIALDFSKLKKLLGNHCLGCWATDKKLTVDHIIPLSKGGTNFIYNIQPLCKSCNSKKSAYYPIPI